MRAPAMQAHFLRRPCLTHRERIMHLGKSYRMTEFIVWTRKQIYLLLLAALIPVLLYQVAGLKWLTLPVTVVSLLGTATAFVVGFKNVQTYSRTLEAQKIWTSIVNASRYWGVISRNFVRDPESLRVLADRHFAWLTALRYELRAARIWETVDRESNAEYLKRHYSIPERQQSMDAELSRYLSSEDREKIAGVDCKAAQLLGLQGQAERIKNFPYPRQYAIINAFFVRSFCFLLPFGLLAEFDKLNASASGLLRGEMTWLVVPFSVMISWIYTPLERVGESTENPFEGSPNDVPISHLSALIERDVKQMQGRADLPQLPAPVNDIVM
jgi:putative membrane protein